MLNALLQSAQMQNLSHMQNQIFHVFFSICDNLCFAFFAVFDAKTYKSVSTRKFSEKISLLQMHYLNFRIIPYGLANLVSFLIDFSGF